MKPPHLESIFLNRSPIPDERDFRRVLVLGGDNAGVELAAKLREDGREVLLIAGSSGRQPPVSDDVAVCDSLEEISGFTGGFEVVVTRAGTQSVEKVGFVAAAAPAQYTPKFDTYGLEKSDRVMSLSELEAALRNDGFPVEPRGEWLHAAFLCGLEGRSDPALFGRVFDAIEKLSSLTQTQAYVFTKNVKVASDGMERRYREIRNAGALFFKIDGPGPTFEGAALGPIIVTADPILNIEIELHPDLLVVDEDSAPSAVLKPLLEAIPSSSVNAPYLQPESPRFAGVTTPKAGIAALGAARGAFGPPTPDAEAEIALEALQAAEKQELPTGLPGPPIVDQAKCTICLTCVRLCPHGAMSFRKRAEADPLSCARCGICAAECPMDAIELAPVEGEDPTGEKVRRELAASETIPKIVAFLCSKSGSQAMEAAGPSICGKLIPIVLPCAGTLDPSHVLAAFRDGADGVLVAGCHTGNCASVFGNILAGERVDIVRNMLEEAGLDPGRVMFTNVASNAPGDFTKAVKAFEKYVGRVG